MGKSNSSNKKGGTSKPTAGKSGGSGSPKEKKSPRQHEKNKKVPTCPDPNHVSLDLTLYPAVCILILERSLDLTGKVVERSSEESGWRQASQAQGRR